MEHDFDIGQFLGRAATSRHAGAEEFLHTSPRHLRPLLHSQVVAEAIMSIYGRPPENRSRFASEFPEPVEKFVGPPGLPASSMRKLSLR